MFKLQYTQHGLVNKKKKNHGILFIIKNHGMTDGFTEKHYWKNRSK